MNFINREIIFDKLLKMGEPIFFFLHVEVHMILPIAIKCLFDRLYFPTTTELRKTRVSWKKESVAEQTEARGKWKERKKKKKCEK